MGYPVRATVAGLAVASTALVVGAGTATANPQLAGLQVALARKGLYTGPVDALPGPLTEAAVLRFQEQAGLVPDGIVGPETRSRLGRFGRPFFGTRAIGPGMKGWDVAVLQYLLVRHRLLATTPDGLFGPRTEAAVIRFQRARGLVPDGVVGPVTAQTLCRLAACAWSAKKAPVAKPATRASVRALLDEWAGYYGVDRHLVRGLAWQESGYQQSVVSKIGAVGVMQVTPETWRYTEAFLIGHPVPSTLEGNVQVGVAYLRYLLQLFGSTQMALAAYNQGPESVARYGIDPETKVYVDDVLALAQRL
jgi:peptidoglycan hydrolase-like protein with peptidoglycan-binding domain